MDNYYALALVGVLIGSGLAHIWTIVVMRRTCKYLTFLNRNMCDGCKALKYVKNDK